MKILVVGSGGREHAIVHAMSRSERSSTVFTAPGNTGSAALATNVNIQADDIDGLLAFARSERIELVIVGPEVPLVLGLADRLRQENILVVGPSSYAAQLEGSKVFAKAFMDRHGIPTATYRTFTRDQADQAIAYVRQHGTPIVVKASGLAAGKGAIVCMSEDEALEAVSFILTQYGLGDAGDEIVLESFMEGEEVSVFAMTDGRDYVLLSSAQDHKRIGEGDTGLNTGGMGAYAPAPLMTDELLQNVSTSIIEPTLHGMLEEGSAYSGILYCGLMITADGAKVVEYNCRLGDPETQVILPLLNSDAIELFTRMADGTLSEYQIDLSQDSAACVVLASEGYPGSYEKGKRITGMEDAMTIGGAYVYHAGVRCEDRESYYTSGGRVLAVTGTGSTLSEALDKAYEGIGHIEFDGKYFRRDIGEKGLARLAVL